METGQVRAELECSSYSTSIRGRRPTPIDFVGCLVALLAVLIGTSPALAWISPTTPADFSILENNGLYPPQVHHFAETPGGFFYFTDEGVRADHVMFTERIGSSGGISGPLDSLGGIPLHVRGVVMDIRFEGATLSDVVGVDPVPMNINHYFGSDPANWRQGITAFNRLTYQDAYPGIDIEYYRNSSGGMKYDLLIEAGADLSQVRIRIDGVDSLRIDENSELVIATPNGDLREAKPVVYQEVLGNRVECSGNYVLVGSHTIGFDMSGHNPQLPVIFDPDLLWSTFLGGNSIESALDVTVDHHGEVIVAGYTFSPSFPITLGSYDTVWNGVGDIFVTRLDPTGSEVISSTFLGGIDFDVATAVDVDENGDVYLTGKTRSSNFPTTAGSYDSGQNGNHDVFVTKLNREGTVLEYSTFIGSSELDEAFDIAYSGSGRVVIVGRTFSPLYRTTPGAYDVTYNGMSDAFATSLDATGTQLVFSTVLGDVWGEKITAVALDSSGDLVLTGVTHSPQFPTTSGAYDSTFADSSDAFVAKISGDGSTLLFSTYLGGGDFDEGHAVAVAPSGRVFVAGHTLSSDFPVTSNAWSTNHGGNWEGFVCKLRPTGDKLLSSTFLGGADADGIADMAVSEIGNLIIGGYTSSSDFPTTTGAYQPLFAGGSYDAFAVGMPTTLATLSKSTFVGGSIDEFVWAVRPVPGGDAILAGETWSSDFPTTPGAVDNSHNSSLIADCFVLGFDPRAPGGVETSTPTGTVPAATTSGIAPNPFNPTTTIRFNLALGSAVELHIHDTRGRLVRQINRDFATAGENEIRWDGRDGSGDPAPSGTYFFRLIAGSESHFHKATLIR